jgi:hypothetical protein
VDPFSGIVWGFPVLEVSQLLSWEYNSPQCRVLSLYRTDNTSWRTWGWD